MSSYRNMLLISSEEYQNLRKNLLYNQAPELTQDLYKVKEHTDTLPVDQKIALEGEVLRQHIKQQNLQQPAPSIVSPISLDDSVVVRNFNSFNKSNKVRSNQIYQHLKDYKTQWNEMGQLLNQNNEPIPNSNIVELIDYITNTKKSARMPAGFQEFLTLIEESQLPRHYLSTYGITRATDYKHLQAITNEDDEEQTTPQKSTWKHLKRLKT